MPSPLVGEGQDGGGMNSNAGKLRKNPTEAEQRLWRHIRNRQLLGCKFRRQAPIGNYIVDFVCFEKKLIIELDGGQHKEQRHYDQARSEWLNSQGFEVIRFWNNDIFKNLEGVKEVVARNLE